MCEWAPYKFYIAFYEAILQRKFYAHLALRCRMELLWIYQKEKHENNQRIYYDREMQNFVLPTFSVLEDNYGETGYCTH